MKLRKKIHDLKKYLNAGFGGAYRQVHRESLERHEKYCKEREGIVVGLDKAIDIVEIEEEEQDQQRRPPQPSPHPGRPTPGRTPQNFQRITEGEELLTGDE